MDYGTVAACRRILAPVMSLLCVSCSMNSMIVSGSAPVMEGGMRAMNQETDLELVRMAMPANLKFLEGFVFLDPENTVLRASAAQGFYGYSFGFVEDEDPDRAVALYRRCLSHALAGLRASGLDIDPVAVRLPELETALQSLDEEAVPSLFWAASCWGKWIDLSRTDPRRLADLARVVAFMERTLELDEGYQNAGPHLFFGIYYGGRPPMLGGDYTRARRHFDRARDLTDGEVLMVDVLQAQFLDRQLQDRVAFHERLTAVVDVEIEPGSDLALQNRISQVKAQALLTREEDWF